jgi:hypothetical protein
MKRLGYTRFVAQGGDWGAVIVDLMAVQAPPELLAIHSNMPGILPPEIAQLFGPVSVAPAPAGLSAGEQRCDEDVSDVYTKGIGYAIQMGLTGLTDRVEAQGGTLLIHSPTGAGTRLEAEIPCGS